MSSPQPTPDPCFSPFAQGLLALGQWNPTTAMGTLFWRWVWTAGDGMVLGPLPAENAWSLLCNVTATDDATKETLIGGYNPRNSSVDFERLLTADLSAEKGGLLLEGESSKEICGRLQLD